MKTHLRLNVKHPALYPDVVELLRKLPASALFHTKYPYRHPAAIFQLSIRQLAGDFSRLLVDYASLRSGAKSLAESDEHIAQSQRILIYSLREYFDDCRMILMCLVDPTLVTKQYKYSDEMLGTC